MTPIAIGVVETGSANLASVLAALRRFGASPTLVRDADAVRRADRLVLPGVGAFGAVMSRLGALGVIDALRERIESGRPVLAICLGLQVLANGSAESPGVAGLGILGGTVQRLPGGVRVPQLGWNAVSASEPGGLVRDGHAYFANSYYLDRADDSWVPTFATHGARLVASVERGAQLACQFHPELSGRWGAELLERWWARC
jgi:imidazole glycerol phosphate synthase glutamine amidotransferase subunit